ncbi:MAG: hypothetical protein AAFV19_06970 [Pseudomonadota bacterium]
MTEPEDAAALYDPRGLILDAYRIEGITIQDCRTIFLDWALGLKDGQDAKEATRALLTHHADQPAGHPMTEVLTASLQSAAAPKRRGGAMARRR